MPTLSALGKIARKKTSEEFAKELSSYTTLTAGEIKKMFPKKADRKELLELLKIVNSATADNVKKAKLVANIGKFGGAVIKVTKKFAV